MLNYDRVFHAAFFAVVKNNASNDIYNNAVMILDINELKKVNDTKGHKAGDEYIRRASRIKSLKKMTG